MTNKTTSMGHGAGREAPRDRARILCDTAGSILSIRIRGEIDHHTASDIRRGIDAILFEKRPKKLLLDLSAVSFMDSSGLGLIMGRYSVMKELEGEMVVWNPSPETRSIMTLAGMERMVRIEYPAGSDRAERMTDTAPKGETEARTSPASRRAAEAPSRPARTSSGRRRKPRAATAATTATSPREERKERDA